MAHHHNPKITTRGLVASYDFANVKSYTSGSTTINNLISTDTGSLVNTPTFQSDGLGSMLFNGTDEYGNIDGVLPLVIPATQGTIEMWLKPVDATPSANETLFCFGDTDADTKIFFFIRTDGTVRFEVRETGGIWWRVTTDAAALSDATWGHLAFTQDGTQPVIYVNDVLVAQTTTSVSDISKWMNDISGLDNGRLGCQNVNSGGDDIFFNGSFGLCNIYNTALTAEEIKNNYNALKGRYIN